MSEVTVRMARLQEARANHESPEVMYELMMDIAAAIELLGCPTEAAEYRRVASTMIPMFGMQAETDRPKRRWWQRKTDWVPPDYRSRADLYRSDVPFHDTPPDLSGRGT